MTSAAAPIARAAATSEAPKPAAKLPFAKVLRDAGFTSRQRPKPLGPPAPPKRLEPGTVLRAAPKPTSLPVRAAPPAITQQLQTVRADGHATAAGLKARRDATTHDDRGAQLERAVDLIGQELKRDFAVVPPAPPPQPAANLQHAPPPPVDPAVRAQATLQLIERIELFTRQNRPALALSLHQSLGARVEIERAGKGAVSMTWVGVNGPPRPDDVQRVREALASRGLSLRSLTVR